jgi:hypothetical protein
VILLALLAGCDDFDLRLAGDGADADLDGWSTVEGDCADDDPDVHPAADERCNGRDDDCDALADAADPSLAAWTWTDADGDGAGGTWARSCDFGERTDCDDGDPLRHPGADDVPCDGFDADCDGRGEEEAMVVIGDREYATFEAAFEAAIDGDRLLVCPGTWTVPGAGVGIELPYWLDDLTIGSVSGSPEDTVLDGGYAGPVIYNQSGSLILENLTLQHGTGYDFGDHTVGGAIYDQSASLTIQGAVLRENEATVGSAVSATADVIDIHDTIVVDNGTLLDSVLWLNSATGFVRVTDVEIGSGQAGPDGGPLVKLVYYGRATAVFERVRIADASAIGVELYGGLGGGIHATFAECELAGLASAVYVERVGPESTLVFDGSRMVRSGASDRGAVDVPEGTRIESIASDWGEGADENLGPDLQIGSAGYSGFGAGATFVCDHDAPCE